MEEKNKYNDNYLFFSSTDLIDFFMNNLADKDIKTQTKRIFEMARVFMSRKGFELEDIYSTLVFVRDMEQRDIVNEVFKMYLREGRYPIRVIVQIDDLEGTADIEIEFSAYKGEKKYVNSNKGHIPTGPFSQGVVIENYVYCSGVRPLDPDTQKLVVGDFKKYVAQCLENLEKTLNEAGTDLTRAYSFMIYLKDMEKLPLVEEVFERYFCQIEQAKSEDDVFLREVMKIDKLNEDHEIEISCSAYIK